MYFVKFNYHKIVACIFQRGQLEDKIFWTSIIYQMEVLVNFVIIHF